MLLFRSISSLHICVLISLIIVVKCQYYNPDYRVSDDLEDEDHSSYKSDDDKPDYSKYYKSEGASSPLIGDHFINGGNEKESESGFVSPLDFSGFLSSSQFGASSKQEQTLPTIALENPFNFQDALKKQNSSGFVDSQEFSAGFSNAPNFELEVGKHFNDNEFEPKIEQPYIAPKDVSYKPKSKNTKLYNYNSEVDDLNGYEAPKYKKPLKKTNYAQNLDYNKPKTDFSDITSKYNAYTPVNPSLSSYSTGKINHLAPVKTYVPQYFPLSKHTNTQTPLSTYQNYNFQPTAGLSNIKSSSAPINLSPTYNTPTSSDYYALPSEYAQPSEYKSQKVQNSNCQKIEKQLSPDDISHGRFRRQAEQMNCFLCKDPKSGGTYEQCSYTSSPEDDNSYFRGHAEKYSTKTYVDPDEHSRERRDTKRADRKNKYKRNENKAEQVDEYRNPFNYEKANAHKFNSKPEEFDDSESYYKAPDFSHYEKDSEDYKFSPKYFTDESKPQKSYSEHQSEEFKKNSENCKKVEKDSMTCMVCSNPKTGGNYEQCSYSYEPKEQKFAYVREKKFKSNEPIDEKSLEGTEPKPSIQRNKSHQQFKPKSAYFSASTKHPLQVKNDKKDDYYISHDFSSDIKDQKENVRDLSRFGKEDEQESKENKRGDYVYKLFPEYAEKESKNHEIKEKPAFQFNSGLPDYFTAEESKKDVDTVLEEFTKKDRSKCKKITKDKMTCYICVDKKGIQHEECMFVSESQPVSSHIAYHEVKEFTSEPKNQKDEITADTKQVSEVKPLRGVKKTKQSFPKKVNSTPIAIKEVDAEPTEYIKVVGKKPRIVRRKTNISKDYVDYLPEESKQLEVKQEKPKNAEEQEDVRSLEPEGPEGAYASELLPIYSKMHGTTLPGYMLDISEGEKIFDEVVKSGR